jgi:hypothetical protein
MKNTGYEVHHYEIFSTISSYLLGPNILLSTPFSKTLSLCSSLKVREQVSHPYSTTGKITVLYILIFIHMDMIPQALFRLLSFLKEEK